MAVVGLFIDCCWLLFVKLSCTKNNKNKLGILMVKIKLSPRNSLPACFLLGPDRGMTLAGEYGAEVLFVMEDGEIVMSEGMKEYFQER